MGRHVFVSGSRAYTFVSRRRRRDSQFDAFQRECSEQKTPSNSGHSTQSRHSAPAARQVAVKLNEKDTQSQSKNPGSTSIVPSGTATQMQVWELMLFFRIPYEQAVAYSYEQASSSLGRLSESQKHAIVKQAQASGVQSRDTRPLRQRASRPTVSTPATRKQRLTSYPKRPQTSKKVSSPDKKQYILPVRFHVLIEARTAVLGRAAGMKSVKCLLKMARAAGVVVETSSLVFERSVRQPKKSKKAVVIGRRR